MIMLWYHQKNEILENSTESVDNLYITSYNTVIKKEIKMAKTKLSYILYVALKVVFICFCIFMLVYCQHSIKLGEIEKNTSSAMGICAIIACIIFQINDVRIMWKERKIYKGNKKVA